MGKCKKIAVLCMTLLTAVGFCGCNSIKNRIQTQINNQNNQYIVDGLYYDYKDNVDYYVFCTDRQCLVNTPGQTGWETTYSGIPADLQLSEGEFAFVTADVTYVSGGVAGYHNAPSLTNIDSQKIVTIDEVIQAGSLADYNPDDSFYGIKKYEDGNDLYLLVYAGYENYRLYLNGRYEETFDTTFDAESAMGIREKIDTDADLEHFGNLKIYVFCCKGRYFIYTGNITFNEKGIWKEFLNVEFGNVPLDFTLKDGEAVVMERAELMRVNGGEGNYKDAPMYLGSDGMENVDLETLIYGISMEHWEEAPATTEFETRQYGVQDALIFLMDGQYYVYTAENGNSAFFGVYDSAEEVTQALENK